MIPIEELWRRLESIAGTDIVNWTKEYCARNFGGQPTRTYRLLVALLAVLA